MPASAAPFDFPGDRRGVLCLHGFTGTPFEVRYLGERLAERGFTVAGPALAGHEAGAGAAGVDASSWRDWTASASAALEALRRRCDRVAVVGLSLGGLLALHLAATGAEVAAIGSLGAPLWLPAPWRLGIRLLAAAGVRHLPKVSRGGDVRDGAMRRANPNLDVFPVTALTSLVEFMALVRAEVPRVTVPCFVAHGRRDHTAPPACAEELARRLGSLDVRRLVLEKSYHLVPIDVERDRLAAELAGFLAERM